MDTFSSKEHGFSIYYPQGWQRENENMEMTDAGSDYVLEQIRIIAMHPNIVSKDDFEERYEEIMIMKQVFLFIFLDFF